MRRQGTTWAMASVCILAWAAAPDRAVAQTEIGGRASTLGLGAEVGVRPSSRIGLRLALYRLNVTREEEVEGIPYELTPRFSSITATADFYPFGKVLFLSGGVIQNDNAVTADAIIGSSITIGNRTYSNAEVQALGGRVDWTRAVAPWVGLGLTTGGRVGIVFEAGVAFTGVPRVSLAGITTLTGAERAAFLAAMEEEEDEIRAWLDEHKQWTRYYPVVSLGLRLRL